MKTLSIILLVLASINAAASGDATASAVAFILFCRECGGDVRRMWNEIINGKGDARDCLPES